MSRPRSSPSNYSQGSSRVHSRASTPSSPVRTSALSSPSPQALVPTKRDFPPAFTLSLTRYVCVVCLCLPITHAFCCVSPPKNLSALNAGFVSHTSATHQTVTRRMKRSRSDLACANTPHSYVTLAPIYPTTHSTERIVSILLSQSFARCLTIHYFHGQTRLSNAAFIWLCCLSARQNKYF